MKVLYGLIYEMDETMKREGVDRIIIDLRNNNGGYGFESRIRDHSLHLFIHSQQLLPVKRERRKLNYRVLTSCQRVISRRYSFL